MIKELSIKTATKEAFVDLTDTIIGYIKDNDLIEGCLTAYVPHTTAGITINDKMPAVSRDILTALDKVYPQDGDYKHDAGNSAAHIKASLMGSSVTVPFKDNEVLLGSWQKIYFCEFDGPKDKRKVYVSIK